MHWHHGLARIERDFIFIVMRMNDVLSEILILYCFLILSSREKYAFRDGVHIRVCVLNRVVEETEDRHTQTQKDPLSLLFFSPTFCTRNQYYGSVDKITTKYGFDSVFLALQGGMS